MDSEELVRVICAAISAGRLPHALLITGAKRQGVADKIAMGLVCRGETRPCGVCGDCLKAGAGMHPGIFRLEPEAKRGVTMAQVRGMIAMLAQRAGGAARVAVADMAGLHVQAQNALLKLLEEPGEGITLLLLGQEADVLPTVRSRCLVLHANEPESAAPQAVIDGALSAFLRLLNDANPWNAESFWLAQKEQAPAVLETWTYAAHDMLRLAVNGKHARLTHENAREALQERLNRFTIRQIHAMIETLWEAGKRLQSNANYALLGQWLLLRLLEEA